MRDALVFNGARNLDFVDIRQNVARIPEVIARLREAQEIWDDLVGKPLDLANTLVDEPFAFAAGPRVLLAALVQIGLLDRYLRSAAEPEFVLATSATDPALRFACGKLHFLDLVTEGGELAAAAAGGAAESGVRAGAGSAAESGARAGVGSAAESGARAGVGSAVESGAWAGVGSATESGARSGTGSATESNLGSAAKVVAVASLAKRNSKTALAATSSALSRGPGGGPAIYRRNESGQYVRASAAASGIENLFVELVDTHEVHRVVLLGPGNTVFGRRVLDLAARDVQIVETIDLDPMLAWFWPKVRENRLAIAN